MVPFKLFTKSCHIWEWSLSVVDFKCQPVKLRDEQLPLTLSEAMSMSKRHASEQTLERTRLIAPPAQIVIRISPTLLCMLTSSPLRVQSLYCDLSVFWCASQELRSPVVCLEVSDLDHLSAIVADLKSRIFSPFSFHGRTFRHMERTPVSVYMERASLTQRRFQKRTAAQVPVPTARPPSRVETRGGATGQTRRNHHRQS